MYISMGRRWRIWNRRCWILHRIFVR